MKVVSILGDKAERYLDLSPDQKAIFVYGLDVLLTTLLGYTCIILPSYLMNTMYIVLPMLLMYSTLRTFSGGAHGSKRRYCISLSVIAFNGFAIILKNILESSVISVHEMIMFNFIVFVIALYIIYHKAPADVKEKPITSEEHRKQLRKYSISVILAWYGVVLCSALWTGTRYQTFIMAISIGILWQAFMVTEWGTQLFVGYEKVLKVIKI